MKPRLCVAMVVVCAATSMAQTPTSKKKTAPVNRSTAIAKDIQALRETVTAQQQLTPEEWSFRSPDSTRG